MADRISEIKERRAKASPGEWIVAGRGNTVPSLAVVVNGTDENIASCIRPKTGNADFIAHAPADIDYLLTELANRDAEIERLREAQNNPCQNCQSGDPDQCGLDCMEAKKNK